MLTPLAQLNARFSGNEDHQNVVFGARVDEGNGVLVVFLALEDKVDPAFAVAPEGLLERGEQFVLEAIADAGDGLLVGLREWRVELDEVPLKDYEVNT